MNKKPILAILALILVQLSCGQYITPIPATMTVTPRPPTEAAEPTVTQISRPEVPTQAGVKFTATVKQAAVNVHDRPGGPVVDWLSGGDTVTVLQCVGTWCEIEKPAGYIWRGCLSGNEDIGCEAK